MTTASSGEASLLELCGMLGNPIGQMVLFANFLILYDSVQKTLKKQFKKYKYECTIYVNS